MESLAKLCKGNTNQQYEKALGDAIQQFQLICRLISCCIRVSDKFSKQELLISNYGLVQVTQTVNATFAIWQNVYDIKIL
jgi:hypothetical protein